MYFWVVEDGSVIHAVSSLDGLATVLRSAHDVASWLDEPETVTATMAVMHDGPAAIAA